ncbi:hypothetical protein EIP91_011965 [Steccherinum ochraceum]|uniref:Peptide hydrolase n=1 Tax=Steccherinum ochraceum TaxID=92696 RepID=A0A4R0RQU7_9APHY|nr:hypothetical protein EIP91_011965 [Steccherinum ochraceum]
MVWYTTPLKFTAGPVSVLAVLIYVTVFISVLVNDQTPDIPKSEGGLRLEKGFHDLQRITARPHAYPSHENDDVRAFLLDRVQTIASQVDYIHVSDDIISNASYVEGDKAAYFEGTNILVKVDGTDASEMGNGVLFSAHYDSVSTGYGATDDGMGIVTLLQLIEYFSVPKRRPRRTAIFFMNNGEEDGLNGAHVFYEHPWSNLTTSFINLEGAGAGGRPLVFRATNLGPAQAFASEDVDHPSANVLGADAFAQGVIRSRTDFQVYAQGIKGAIKGMEGADLAFYKKRSVYHTPLDSISGMGIEEGRRALWSMMDATRGAGLVLLNEDRVDSFNGGGVYFDLLGNTLLAFPRRYLFIVDVVLLILGPISVLVLLGWVLVLSQKHTNAGLPDQEPNTWPKIKKILVTALGWGRFWISLAIAILAQVGLVIGYVKLNPFVAHSYPSVVVATSLTLSYLGFVLPFAFFQFFFPSPPSSQKLATTLELYFLTWIFLVVGTVLVNKLELGGTYWITGWYICTWLAALIALGEGAERAKKGGEEGGKGELSLVGEAQPEEQDVGERRYVRGVRYERVANAENENGGGETSRTAVAADEPVETEPTEITPLMHQHRRRSGSGHEYVVGIDGGLTRVKDGKGANAGYEETGWWIAQMLVVIPIPALLKFQLLVLLVHSLGNTMVDGSSPVIVYGAISLLSILIMLNIMPFAHRLHQGLTWMVLIVFVLSLLFSWAAFPFTPDAPLKLFFQQRLELDLSSSHGSVTRAQTLLTGPEVFVDQHIIPYLPSSSGKPIVCETDRKLRKGLRTCKWDSRSLLPSPGGHAASDLAPNSLLASSRATRASDWIHTTFRRHEGKNATISVRGTNTRACSLTFDRPISAYHVHGSSGVMQAGYEVPPEGVKLLPLWSREWEKEFVVDVQWTGPDETMEGRVACNWVEYASGTAGSEWVRVGGQIPALEEVMRFLPLWAIPTKWTVGLVEAGGRRFTTSLNRGQSQSQTTQSDRPILRIVNSSIYSLGAGTSSRPVFRDVSWTINQNEAWAVLSTGSSSGKTSLLQALTGHLRITPPPPPPDGLFPFLQGRDPHNLVSLVSFAHRSRSAGGAFVDFTARYGAVREEDKRTLRETFFPETARPLHTLAIPSLLKPTFSLKEQQDAAEERARRMNFEGLVDVFGLREFMDLPVVVLSNGQTRRARVLKALLETPEVLILDEPLTGLDVEHRASILDKFAALHHAPEPPHIIMGYRLQDPLPEWTTHVALVQGNSVVQTGRKEDVMASHTGSTHGWTPSAKLDAQVHKKAEEVLVEMDNMNVSYDDRKVLKDISWKIHANSRWHLIGANGAGKTTILAMLTGEHPQSYTQSSHLRLFSRPRARWPTPHLHARIGRVSPELHNAYPRRAGVKVWDVIGTAFDGGFVPRGRKRVGLSADGTELEEGGQEERKRIERMWHVLQGLGPRAWDGPWKVGDDRDRIAAQAFADRQFVDLSPGEQSVVLLMRALVTQPPLVLLDEAWAGMDEGMVEAARRYLRHGGGLKDGQACVVISHWEDEVPWGWEDGVRRFKLVDGVGKEVPRPT